MKLRREAEKSDVAPMDENARRLNDMQREAGPPRKRMAECGRKVDVRITRGQNIEVNAGCPEAVRLGELLRTIVWHGALAS